MGSKSSIAFVFLIAASSCMQAERLGTDTNSPNGFLLGSLSPGAAASGGTGSSAAPGFAITGTVNGYIFPAGTASPANAIVIKDNTSQKTVNFADASGREGVNGLTFSLPGVPDGTSYDLSVSSPVGLTCTLAGVTTGTINGADVSGATINCSRTSRLLIYEIAMATGSAFPTSWYTGYYRLFNMTTGLPYSPLSTPSYADRGRDASHQSRMIWDGRFYVIVYFEEGSIFLQRLDVSGNPVDSAIIVSDSTASNPDVAYDPVSSRYLVVYQRRPAIDQNIYGMVVDASSLTATGAEITMNNAATVDKTVPRTIAANGYFVTCFTYGSSNVYCYSHTSGGVQKNFITTGSFPSVAEATLTDEGGTLVNAVATNETDGSTYAGRLYLRKFTMTSGNIYLGSSIGGSPSASNIDSSLGFYSEGFNLHDLDIVYNSNANSYVLLYSLHAGAMTLSYDYTVGIPFTTSGVSAGTNITLANTDDVSATTDEVCTTSGVYYGGNYYFPFAGYGSGRAVWVPLYTPSLAYTADSLNGAWASNGDVMQQRTSIR